jgi:protein-S-isoprenylcysteine O-methyltransferase Ste14
MTQPRENAVQPAVPGPAVAAVVWGGALLFAASLGFYLFCYFVRFGEPAAGNRVLAPLLTNVGLFTIFALHHSVMARSGAKSWLHRHAPAYLERSLYTWVSSVLFILVCAWWEPVAGVIYRATGPWALIGYTVQSVGVVMTARGAGAIDVLDLAGVRPYLLARAGASPRHVPLETRGMYRLVRHPLYLAWALLVFGTPTLTGTRAVFAVVSTAYLALAIPFEERGLLAAFGSDYRAYQRQVRWRMIPGIY